MLHITNGVVNLTVTKGAFASFYKERGFHIVTTRKAGKRPGVVTTHGGSDSGHSAHSSQPKSPEEEEAPEEDPDEEELEEEDLSEIPLGEMDFQQLNDYADQLGVEHEGIRSKKELRALIRDHLKE